MHSYHPTDPIKGKHNENISAYRKRFNIDQQKLLLKVKTALTYLIFFPVL